MKKINGDNLLERNKFLEKRNKELEIFSLEKKNGPVPVSLGQIYHTLFRLSPNAIIVSRVEDGTIYDVNDYFCQATGFSRKEIIGKTTVELNLWLGQDRERMVKTLSRNGRFKNLEVKHRMKDGTIKTCLDSGELITIGDERYIISVEIDITERKEVEKALRESEMKYRELVKYAPTGIYEIDHETGHLKDVNDIICEYTGYTREELLNMNLYNLLTEESQKCMAERIEKLFAGEEIPQSVEYCIKTKNGEKLWVIVSPRYIYEGGKFKGVSGIIYNITERKRIEEAFLRESNFSRAALDSLKVLFFMFDANGNILRWNKHSTTVSGYSDEEIVHMTVFDFVAETERSNLQSTIINGFKTGYASYEMNIICKDGMVKPHLCTGNLVFLDGKPYGIGMGIDITDQKRSENELKHFAENLEDANIALRILMNKRNEDQKEFEEKLQVNINDLVIPYLTKLSTGNLDDRNKNYLSVLESNLSNVLSPFMRDFRSSHKNLTPHEFQIVDLILKGKNTKEIADMLNASVKTIATHRNNIRKKLNLINSKINLRSYILSLQ